MSRASVARAIVTGAALFLAIVPPLADINESHILNPLWTGHARLHTTWLITTNALIALGAIGLMWRARGASVGAIRAASALVGCVLAGFFVAAATRPLYGGALTDPNGVAQGAGPIDANLAAFSLLAIGVMGALFLVRGAGESRNPERERTNR